MNSAEAGPRRALAMLLAGAVFISLSAVFTRAADVAPTVSGFYRMLFGGLALAGLLALRPGMRAGIGRNWLGSLVIAIFFTADLWFWHRSIWLIGPGLSTLLANFQVFVLTLIGVVFFRERFGPRAAAGLGLAMLGLWLLFGRDWAGLTPDARLGVILGLLTAAAYSGYVLSLRQFQTRHPAIRPEARLLQVCILCGAMMLTIALVEGHTLAIPDGGSLAALVAYGVVCQVGGWLLITRGMPHIAASVVGLVLLLQPTLSIVWDMIFFGLRIGPWQGAGCALALVGIYVGVTRRARKRSV